MCYQVWDGCGWLCAAGGAQVEGHLLHMLCTGVPRLLIEGLLILLRHAVWPLFLLAGGEEQCCSALACDPGANGYSGGVEASVSVSMLFFSLD